MVFLNSAAKPIGGIQRVRLLMAGAGLAAMLAGAARAETADGSVAGAGSEATSVEALIVTAERTLAAATAPTKASLDAFQPQSIISHNYIEKFTPENGDYTTVLLVAPSIAGISENGGGIGDSNKNTLRGFKDGQYNLTYDGIAMGDTNDPTHHPADYFPASNIGAAVVDRGPGAAGDLGQANYGGAVHLFSPVLSDRFEASLKGSYGTWNTAQGVLSLQSGEIKATGGTRALLVLDYRGSDGELSGTNGLAYNGLLKIQQPLGEHGSVTLFSAYEYTRFFQPDVNFGETWAQVGLYGKNFLLSKDPAAGEFWQGFNHIKKTTDFEYVKFNYDFGHGLTVEDQAYTYFYSNKTFSANDNTGILGGPNTSPPKSSANAASDIGGYDKLNRYRVYGDVIRVNKDFRYGGVEGTAKIGAIFEGSDTDRHNVLYDLTTGAKDPSKKLISANASIDPAYGNVKTLETSSWSQYQIFMDLILKPTDRLTISPGVKYVNFTRTISGTGPYSNYAQLNCSIESSVVGTPSRACISGANTYEKPLYFATANYKITPNWSIYGQTATGFLIPALSSLYSNGLSLQNLKPTETTNYQAGTVYSKGRLTLDGDVYKIFVSNQQISNAACQCYVNGGRAHYSGAEGEIAYAFPFGLTLFANGSINSAKNMTTGVQQPSAPKWTDAVGALYTHNGLQASLIWKEVGTQMPYQNGASAITTPDGVALVPYQERTIGSYNVINASLGYDFGRVKAKVGVFNLADHRAVVDISGTGAASDFYSFQAGREVLLTLEAKFH